MAPHNLNRRFAILAARFRDLLFLHTQLAFAGLWGIQCSKFRNWQRCGAECEECRLCLEICSLQLEVMIPRHRSAKPVRLPTGSINQARLLLLSRSRILERDPKAPTISAKFTYKCTQYSVNLYIYIYVYMCIYIYICTHSKYTPVLCTQLGYLLSRVVFFYPSRELRIKMEPCKPSAASVSTITDYHPRNAKLQTLNEP